MSARRHLESLLDSLPPKEQEQRHAIARKLREQQLKRYYEREKMNEQRGGPRKRQGRVTKGKTKKVQFLSQDRLRDAIQHRDMGEAQQILVEELVSVDGVNHASGASLIHQCCLDNNIPGVELLLECNANINIQDDDLWTPLHVASACGYRDMVVYLLEHSADCTLLDVDGNFAYDVTDDPEIQKPLMKYMEFRGIYERDLRGIRSQKAKAMLAAVKEHIAQGWDLNQLNRNGVSLLHIAAANGYYQICRLLLDAGAHLHVLDDQGYTALHVAAKYNQEKIVKLLLERKADATIKSYQLECAIDLTDSEAVLELLKGVGGDHSPPPSPTKKTTKDMIEEEEGKPSEPTAIDAQELTSVSIDLEEFESSREPSRSLNRQTSLSKIEELFEAETLSEKHCFDEGSDITIQLPALYRLRKSMKRKRASATLDLPDPAVTDDLASLSDLDEAILLQYLKERYDRDQIYTCIGDILVAVNPYKPLPFYNDLVSGQYSSDPPDPSLPPHIFAVAQQTYCDMKEQHKPQCCIISGESGAGKTESCKLIVQHLMAMSESMEKDLNTKIEQVNPLLEAFGNAKTVMNDNSSRFGKYLELQFTEDGQILGAIFKEYILEKSRVIHQGYGERNFHIFYLLFAGLPQETKLSLNLHDPSVHSCLKGHGEPLEMEINGNGKRRLDEVWDSLQAIGFSKDDELHILQTLAAVIHISDICFAPEGEGSKITNMDKVESVGSLLQVDPLDLAPTLTQESMVTRGDQIFRNRTVLQANDCRDALAKALYARMFGWIVNGINHHLQAEDVTTEHPFRIGVLDIFGFENFKHNSFEQMCINVANEQLQYYFNNHVFKMEQEECSQEGIDMEAISFTSNWPVVDLFLEKNCGLLALIDEESHFPKGTDQTLATKLHRAHSGKAGNLYMAPPDGGLHFQIAHFAGDVKYDVTGFLDKNRDTLSVSVSFLMRASGSLLLREIFGNKLTRTGSIAPSVRHKLSRRSNSPFAFFNKKASHQLTRSRSKRSTAMGKRQRVELGKRSTPTVAGHFKNSLKELMEKVNVATPHFVRCLKPNDEKVSDNFCADCIKLQLKYTGILETIRIRRCGFPTRLTYDEFLKRYPILEGLYVPAWSQNMTSKEAVLRILGHVPLSDWKQGRTKVLLKYYHPAELHKCSITLCDKIELIQNYVRYWIAYKRYQREQDKKGSVIKVREKDTRRKGNPEANLSPKHKSLATPDNSQYHDTIANGSSSSMELHDNLLSVLPQNSLATCREPKCDFLDRKCQVQAIQQHGLSPNTSTTRTEANIDQSEDNICGDACSPQLQQVHCNLTMSFCKKTSDPLS